MLKFFVHSGLLKKNKMRWKIYVAFIALTLDLDLKSLRLYKDAAVIVVN